jgi:hypothetical protein
VEAVVRGRIAALGAVTAAVMAGFVPLPTLAALTMVVTLLGACEVRGGRAATAGI